MTLSGTYSFSMSRDQVITAAVRQLGILDQQLPRPDAIVRHSLALNMMLKSWQLQNIGLWLLREITLFPALNTARYAIGSSGTNFTLTPVETTLAADAALGALTISGTSATGIANNSNIGIKLDDGTRQWTTVNGAPSGTTITLAAALTAAASEDNTVKAYASKAQRPLRILEARWKTGTNEIPLNIIDRDEYIRQTNKSTTGMPVMLYYDPQLTTGYVNFWPAPNTVDAVIPMTATYQIEDMTASSDDFEIPVEWYNAVVYNLANEIMNEYGTAVSEAAMERVMRKAESEFSIARNHDAPISVQFVANPNGR